MTGYTAQVGIDHVAAVGVVVLSNGDNAALTPITQALLRAAGVPATPASTPPIAAGGVVPDLQAYVGTYRNPRRFTVEVVRKGDDLVLRRFGRDFPLRIAGEDRFVTDLPRGGTETIAFGRGSDGRADYLQMNAGRSPAWAADRSAKPDPTRAVRPGRDVASSTAYAFPSSQLQIGERTVGDVTILLLSGEITLDDGDPRSGARSTSSSRSSGSRSWWICQR